MRSFHYYSIVSINQIIKREIRRYGRIELLLLFTDSILMI